MKRPKLAGIWLQVLTFRRDKTLLLSAGQLLRHAGIWCFLTHCSEHYCWDSGAVITNQTSEYSISAYFFFSSSAGISVLDLILNSHSNLMMYIVCTTCSGGTVVWTLEYWLFWKLNSNPGINRFPLLSPRFYLQIIQSQGFVTLFMQT